MAWILKSVFLKIPNNYDNLVGIPKSGYIKDDGYSKQSGWSAFGRTTISQGCNKIPFCKKQVINKSPRVILGLLDLLYHDILDKKHMMRWKIISHPCVQNILCYTRYSIVQKLSNKQYAKVICRFDRLITAQSKRQKVYEHWKTYQPPTHLIT